MHRFFIINKYLALQFFKVIVNVILIFSSLAFIMNIFEEINFFKDYNVNVAVPIMLSFLFIPSLLNNFFPFVILLSGIWFFLKIKKTDEITAMKVSGMSNFSVIMIPSILSIIIGIFFVTTLNPITSSLVKKYESIKGSYEKDQEYLAAITVNGIWIKEKSFGKNNLIRSSKLENDHLLNLSIYEFDENNNFVRRIEAKSANISSSNWVIKDARIISEDGTILSDNIENISYRSMYDIKKIKSL